MKNDGRSEARFSIYNADQEWAADTLNGEDAAALVAVLGDDAFVTDAKTGTVLWNEGSEDFPAADSYDNCTEIMESRRLP